MLGPTDGTASGDSPIDPGLLGPQGGPQTIADGVGSKNSFGDCGILGSPKAQGAAGSRGQEGVRVWPDGSGTTGSMGYSVTPSWESGAESWPGTAAQAPGHDGASWKAGPGTTDGNRAVDQGALAPPGAGDSQLGDGRTGADSWGPAGVDSGSAARAGGEAMSGPMGGRGMSNAQASGLEDQGFGHSNMRPGVQLSGSRAYGSLHETEATLGGTHKGPGGSQGREGATGQEVVRGHQGPEPLGSREQGPGKGKTGHTENLSGSRQGAASGQGDGPNPKPEESGSWETRSGSDGDRARGTQLGKGKRGGWVSPGMQGCLWAEARRAQGPAALTRDKVQGAGESGRLDQRPGAWIKWSKAQAGAEVGVPERRDVEEARGKRQPPGGEQGGCPGESLSEAQSQQPPKPFGSQGGHSDAHSISPAVTRSPRARDKASVGALSTDGQGKCQHGFFQALGCWAGSPCSL